MQQPEDRRRHETEAAATKAAELGRARTASPDSRSSSRGGVSARRLTITFVNAACAHVTGYGSRDLITELRGRPPVWSTVTRAWVMQPRGARDLIAVAEARGFDVVVNDGEIADPGGGRW